MKYIVFSLFLLLTISNASAVLIEGKDVYAPGETLIAKLGFVPLQPIGPAQIQLLRDGHILVPSEAAVVRLGSDYFIYSSLPLNSSNLNLRIKDVYRLSGGSQVKEDIDKNISFSDTRVPYSILPGAISAREPKMDFKIISYADANQQIYVAEQNNRTITLTPGENRISISTDPIPEGFSLLHLGDYAIPVYLDSKTIIVDNSSQNESDHSVRLDWAPARINGVILSNRDVYFSLAIINRGSKKIKDIVLDYDSTIFYLPIDHISSLDVGEKYYLNLTIKKTTSSLDQIITARYDNEAFDLPVTILVTNNASEVKSDLISSNGTVVPGRYCLELNGNVCSSSQTCSGTLVTTIDQAQCCVGTCSTPTKKNNVAWLGYLIGAIVLIILVIVGGKYLKSKKSEDGFAKRLASAEKS